MLQMWNTKFIFNLMASFTIKNFIFGEKIGVGKFGIVYKAIEKETQFKVAIKIIPKNKITSEILYIQLKREIQIQSRLKHNNICQLYAYFTDTNNIFLVMQLCQNGNLYVPIKKNREKFSNKKIASIFKQLLSAVAYLKERNVMHRDIKLENVLFDENYNVKIADFGWCIHTATTRTTFCGTMEYICPQMLKNQNYGHEVDMYCLGIILYELFCQKSPFIDKTEQQTLQNIKQGVFLFDEDFRQIPQSAKDLIILLLTSDRKARPEAKQLLKNKFLLQFLIQ